MCGSHAGTTRHAAVLKGMHQKIGTTAADLACGVHWPYDAATREAMKLAGQQPTVFNHNCSGKHTGMLAFARMEKLPIENYIDPQHPIQKIILAAFAEMCRYPIQEINLGTDGCSAPVFAIPLYNAALGFARLCDPEKGEVAPARRAEACRLITTAMTSHPDMVGGPGRFDTLLMQAFQGRVVSKAGAEAYQALGLMPGVLQPNSPGIGIAYKISDGDSSGRARHAVGLEILRQLGLLSSIDMQPLADFGPEFPIYNWRKLRVGKARPCFTLQS